ncbi:MAG: choice-of-anchor J domain-containing protein [Bacteroidota bacterium]
MLKTLHFILFVCLFGLVGSLQAQEILFEETFNDSTLGQFTTVSVIGDNQTWIPRNFDGKFFAQMNGFSDGIQDNEDWLISPALNMDAYADEILTFETASNFDGPDLQLVVSTDYDGAGDPSSFTWTDLSTDVNWSPGGFEYVDSGELDLSSFTGTGYFAFVYTSNTNVQGKLWQLDSVVVRATTLTTTEEPIQESRLISNPVVRGDELVFFVYPEMLDMDFTIYHMNGQLLQRFKQSTLGGFSNHSVATLPKGMYVLQVRSERGMQAYQFVR